MNLVVADATLGNDSALATALFDLLKNTRELEYMAHQFHWNIVGVKFNTMHEFYEEEYKQLFEDQDEIAEQIRQQGFFVPVINNVLLEENYSASGFEEQLIAYAGKLTQNIDLIDKANDLAKNEIAVQDLCARLKGLRGLSLNLKVKAMLGGNKMSLEPSEATAATMYKVEFKDIHSNREEEKFINLKDANARYKELKNRCGKGGDIEWVEKPVKYTTNQTYKSNVKVDSKSAKMIKEALKNPDRMGEDDTIRHTAKFSNGYEMDIKCCGTQDETAWTEAILYDDKGNEVRVSDVSDDYFGEWELEDDNGNKYIAKVTASVVESAAEKTPLLEKILRSWASKKGYKVNKWNHGMNIQFDILPSNFNKTTDKEYENSVLFVIQVDEKDKVARVKTKSFGDSLCNLDLNAIGTTPTRKLNTILDSFIPDTDYWGHLVYRPYPLFRKLQTERKIAKATADASAVTANKDDYKVGSKVGISLETLFESKKNKKGNKVSTDAGHTIEFTKDGSSTYYDLDNGRTRYACSDGEVVTVIKNDGKFVTFRNDEGEKSETFKLSIPECNIAIFKSKITASAVTAGFDKARYKEIDEESKFFKILKDDCDIRAKNFYAINKGLRLAIKVIRGTFEDASIRFFALKNKGGYIRVELKDKVYIVGYTIYESGKIKVWTRELKSNVPVNYFDYDMLNMYAKPFGTKMISGLVPTWMSI